MIPQGISNFSCYVTSVAMFLQLLRYCSLVNVESCTKSKLVISTYGAEDGGLVYIQVGNA